MDIMPSVKLLCYAKINLALAVTGKLADGFHSLTMLNASVSVSDSVTVRPRRDEVITCRMDGKLSEHNSAASACALFMAEYGAAGADIEIQKGIPFSAGLGGSSADAAAVLCALAKIYGREDGPALSRLALRAGSDVPYMMRGGFALASGRGEELEFFSGKPLNLVVLKSGGVSTKAAYAEFAKAPKYGKLDPDLLRRAAETGDAAAHFGICFNSFLPYSQKLCPAIGENLELLKGAGARRAGMTGSGSAVFGIFENAREAARAAQSLSGKAEYCAHLRTVSKGIVFQE